MLFPRPGFFYIDGTLGLASHSRRILDAAPGASLVAFDRDPEAIVRARAALAGFGDRVLIHNADFKEWADRALPSMPLGGCLLDLGLSSLQIEGSGRGFSFRVDEPLDMRMDPGASQTAAGILNAAPEMELQRIFRDLGEVPFWRRLARAIVDRRRQHRFERTGDLVDVIGAAAPYRGRSHNPATLPFMALRIAVNGELEGLDVFLRDVAARLAPTGRIVVLSYHSLEDRIVKNVFRDLARAEDSPFTLLTKKPLRPSDEEIRANPRSRSAKLRAIARLAESGDEVPE